MMGPGEQNFEPKLCRAKPDRSNETFHEDKILALSIIESFSCFMSHDVITRRAIRDHDGDPIRSTLASQAVNRCCESRKTTFGCHEALDGQVWTRDSREYRSGVCCLLWNVK